MTLPNDMPLQKLQFYVTTPYTCGYLQGKLAQSLIAAPQHLVNASVYNSLIQQGFRRSGNFAYRPHCENCQECIPVRIVLSDFVPNRSQKRAYKQHQHLSTAILPVAFYEEHYALYHAYQQARHAENLDKATAQNDVEQYRNFLCQTNVESVLVEFRENGQLKMVSVIDVVSDGISAVYTFYEATKRASFGEPIKRASYGDPIKRASYGDPIKRASYGTYNVLWQIEWAKRLALPYLYLGYWVKDSQKMAYKQNFQPQQMFMDGEWR